MNLIHDGEDLKNGPFKLGKLYAHEQATEAFDRQIERAWPAQFHRHFRFRPVVTLPGLPPLAKKPTRFRNRSHHRRALFQSTTSQEISERSGRYHQG